MEADDEKLVFDENSHTYETFELPETDKGDSYTIKRVPAPLDVPAVPPPPAPESASLAQAQDVPMQPAELVEPPTSADASPLPPPVIPDIDITTPSSPPLAPPADVGALLFGDIGDQDSKDMEIDSDNMSAEDLPAKMGMLNTACESFRFHSTLCN